MPIRRDSTRPTGRFGTFEKEEAAKTRTRRAIQGANLAGGVDDGGAPQFDLGRVRELSQEQMAPGISQIRRAIQGTQAGRFRSPTERREAIRGAVRGGGEAFSSLQAQGTRGGLALYGPEYQSLIDEFQRQEQERRRDELAEFRRGRDLGSSQYLGAGIGGGRLTPSGAGSAFAPTPAPIMPQRFEGGTISNQLLAGTSFASGGIPTQNIQSPSPEATREVERRNREALQFLGRG